MFPGAFPRVTASRITLRSKDNLVLGSSLWPREPTDGLLPNLTSRHPPSPALCTAYSLDFPTVPGFGSPTLEHYSLQFHLVPSPASLTFIRPFCAKGKKPPVHTGPIPLGLHHVLTTWDEQAPSLALHAQSNQGPGRLLFLSPNTQGEPLFPLPRSRFSDLHADGVRDTQGNLFQCGHACWEQK